ncbi:MAG: S26 family signal peptidase [Candidatus Bathyarchaeia archaeon]
MKTLLQSLKVLQRRQRYLKLKASRLLSNPKRLFALLSGIGVLCLLGYSLSSSIAVSYGNSVDKKVFWKTAPEALKRGDYVIVKTEAEDPFAKGRLITKKIGCTEGQTLEIKGDDYYCEGDYLGRAKHKSKTGIPVKPFNPCDSESCRFPIPGGHCFVVGTHPDSYDSRYFGPVPYEKIVWRLIPLW